MSGEDEGKKTEVETNGVVEEPEGLDIPKIGAEPEQQKKKKGLLGVLPGAAGAGKSSFFGSLVSAGVMRVAMVAVTAGLVGVGALMKSASCPDCDKKKNQQQLARKAGQELPSDKYADRVAGAGNLDNESLLRAKNAGMGMKFGDDAEVQQDAKVDSADAGAKAGVDKNTEAAAAAAAQPPSGPDVNKMVAEMQKKGFGDGGMGGGGAFGGGGGLGGGGGFGNKITNYAPEAKFSGKLGGSMGGGKASAARDAKLRASMSKGAKGQARLRKSMNQLKLAAAMSAKGRGAKRGTLAAAYGSAAFDQNTIKGSGGIGGAGLAEGGPGMGSTPDILTDDKMGPPGKEPPTDDKCKQAAKGNKQLTEKMKAMQAVRWDKGKLDKPPEKCCKVGNYNEKVQEYRKLCKDYNDMQAKANEACGTAGASAEQDCNMYDEVETCSNTKCFLKAIIGAIMVVAGVLLAIFVPGVGAAVGAALISSGIGMAIGDFM